MWLGILVLLGEFVFIAIDEIRLFTRNAQCQLVKAVYGEFIIVIHKHDEITINSVKRCIGRTCNALIALQSQKLNFGMVDSG